MSTLAKRDFRLYFGLYLPYRLRLIGLFVLYAIKHGVWMVFPLLIKQVIDVYIPHGEVRKIFLCIPVVLAMGVVNLLCHSPYRALVAELLKSVSRDLRTQIINKLQILSLSFLSHTETGRYYSKIMVDVNKLEGLGNVVLTQMTGAVFTFVYASVFLLLVNAKMLLAFLVIVPVYVLIYRIFHRRFEKYQHQVRMADEDLSQSVNQFIQTSSLSRIHGEEEFERNRVVERGDRIVEKYKRISFSLGIFNILIATSSQMFQISIIAFSALAVISGHMTLGALVIFYQYMTQMVNSVISFIDIFPSFVESAESLRSIQEILNTPDIEQNEAKRKIPSVRGEIEFRDVDFCYEPGKKALDCVSVKILQGQTIALVGASGSGKSTFVNAALGLLRPHKGRIFVDGQDVNDIDMRVVRKFVGVVTQQPILFRGTIAENIAHAKVKIDEAEVIEAAKRANAHEFIETMPKQYQTMVGEQGATLSGGQRQRIAIARAILRKPSILVLDEATSALDSISEREVQKGILYLLGRQTTLTIAHRLSTIRDADLILVFRQGRIIERGTHSQLLQAAGTYASMFAAQSMTIAEDSPAEPSFI